MEEQMENGIGELRSRVNDLLRGEQRLRDELLEKDKMLEGLRADCTDRDRNHTLLHKIQQLERQLESYERTRESLDGRPGERSEAADGELSVLHMEALAKFKRSTPHLEFPALHKELFSVDS
ncbi:uncharacterized protein LOC120354315 [Nilaparvata lugens]|uniref:uncharacterized protein LOC120354315 n=1 Tax=Nilaparvata lugens TaxID=108931 RepID=UPI00193E6329|nr:uncharacterized protein LOC120354315 [Nilaparvata lugens]XP_039297203.1 uncharacterized protein LOC120354315 [Nilaparvata lugens]